mmetsp:Transcript_28092/g.38636  ORF Transcript_28092/g.38636 Transcript_28092/m.38636 type:complete len:196 (+) Transcript_28092:42-629(+)|eukprot:CAMPEP_0170074020 /NCGR_PEP_ID=MMETSP0019_2-20121128/11376_1 /TAXON_ID=98059 /ORGANISM="Dinobryon sp., Strain UTEXLB2267" /LENGTH=195 /DNA_ID=CAMNT_0010284009 /DNA_START=30 /DNA_END=617 /DNA_ORIENTATION=-
MKCFLIFLIISYISNSFQQESDISTKSCELDNSCVADYTPSKIPIRQAFFTFYESYPMCCPDSPNYDPSAPVEDCDDYTCCEYSGDFAALGHKPLEFVEKNNLVVLYDNKDPDGEKWHENYGNKTIEISKMYNGKLVTFNASIADACVNADCDGCCSRDSQSTGYLLVMEYYTVLRHFGSDKAVNGLISFRVFDE